MANNLKVTNSPDIRHFKNKALSALLFIIIVTTGLYIQITGFDFVSYDDLRYVKENPNIADGLTGSGIQWALNADYDSNWFPLTWVSHMADVSVFGMSAGGHHFTNLIIHLINICLLFRLFWLISEGNVFVATGAATVFAVHPLGVESVAWISERKNLLSTLFWLLSIICYLKYAAEHKRNLYLLSILFFIFALMSKPMAVTLPFVLLLIDFWPLKRLNNTRWQVIFTEKLPFLVFTLLSSIITFKLQHDAGVISDFTVFPAGLRILNSINSYIEYLIKLAYPTGLAVIYPYIALTPGPAIILKAAALLLITAFALWKSKLYPYLITGWFFYIGTLVPVIQIVQIGLAPMSDRYTYIPMMGIYIMLSFGIKDLIKRFPKTRYFFIPVFILFVSALCVLTYFQTSSWRDSQSLYKQAIKVSPYNFVAYNNYGLALMEAGRTDEAIEAFSRGLSIVPTSRKINYSMYLALMKKGLPDEAAVHMLISSYMGKDKDKQIALSLIKINQHDRAVYFLQEHLKKDPADTEAFNALYNSLIKLKRYDEAEKYLFQF
ncbi:MAG: tetratricopeptide repeat protein [Nitrospirae bacterium YQR-1]